MSKYFFLRASISQRTELALFSFILIFSIFFVSADAFEGIKVYDEGVTVYGAWQVMQGELPYRDFWTVYMPGHFYLYALVFKVFEPSLLAERITSIILIIGIGIFAYLIARKVLPAFLSLLAFFFSVVWLSSFDFFGYIIHPTLFFGLISFFFFMDFLQEKKKNALFLAGIFAGLTALFRHDLGFYVFFTELLILILHQFSLTEHTNSYKEKVQISLKGANRLILGTALIFVPVAVYFLIKVPFKELYNSLIVFPREIYPDYRRLLFPAPFITYEQYQSQVESGGFKDYLKENMDHLYHYFPVIVYFALSLQLLIRGRKRKTFLKSHEFWISTSFILLGFLFFSKDFVRSQYLNLMSTYVIAIIVYFMVLANISKTLANSKVNFVARMLLYLLAIPVLIRPLWSESVNILSPDKKEQLDIARAVPISWDVRGADYEKVIQYVSSRVPASEKIFVGSVRHDRIFNNDVMFYFLAERESPVKYTELHPGVATTREVQEKIIEDISSSGVRVIVLKEETTIEMENKSSESSGVTLLDDYIRENYHLDKRFGEYSVWVKNDTTQIHDRISVEG